MYINFSYVYLMMHIRGDVLAWRAMDLSHNKLTLELCLLKYSKVVLINIS